MSRSLQSYFTSIFLENEALLRGRQLPTIIEDSALSHSIEEEPIQFMTPFDESFSSIGEVNMNANDDEEDSVTHVTSRWDSTPRRSNSDSSSSSIDSPVPAKRRSSDILIGDQDLVNKSIGNLDDQRVEGKIPTGRCAITKSSIDLQLNGTSRSSFSGNVLERGGSSAKKNCSLRNSFTRNISNTTNNLKSLLSCPDLPARRRSIEEEEENLDIIGALDY